MRLIDETEYQDKIAMIPMEERTFVKAWQTAQEMPTVKAIPIDWMKKFANERALNDGMDCYWHFWGEDLLQMIEKWEKENEGKENKID